MAFIVCCWPGSLGTSSLPGFCNKAIRALQEGVVGFRVWVRVGASVSNRYRGLRT